MIDGLIKKINGKNVLILGFGREGESTYQLLRKILPSQKISIADRNNDHESLNNISKTDNYLTVIKGMDYLNSIKEYDFIFKSPGINIRDVALKPGSIVSSQTQLLLEFFSKQTIGITGTKGKSTTSSLIYHLLKESGKDCILVGNIGIPPFLAIDQIKPATIIVFELSAHQLESINVSPHIAILLNVFEEHLDYFKNFENYKQCKLNICRNQIKSDYIIANSDLTDLCELKKRGILSNLMGFSLSQKRNVQSYVNDDVIYLNINNITEAICPTKEITTLKGTHNLYNIMAAFLACRLSGITPDQLKMAVKTFKSLEHRLEYIGTYNRIVFYNDSISTIPESTIEAVKSLPETDTLILGGFDRGINFEALVRFLIQSNIRNFIFMGPAGRRMKLLFDQRMPNDKNLIVVNSLMDSAEFIVKHTQKGKICLLSPAAASYDAFKDFEDRGNIFKKIARSL